MGRILLILVFCFFCREVLGQSSYRNELGGTITRAQFEEKILNGPYFGVPGENPDEKVLVYRMPVGKVENPEIYYEKTGNQLAYKAGKSLIVVFYPGPDECNLTSRDFEISAMEKALKSLTKWSEKRNAAAPVFVFKSDVGLERYSHFMDWNPDPDGIFEKQFFKYPYPCKSFVVLHHSGAYRAILGDFPLSQIDYALKKLQFENR